MRIGVKGSSGAVRWGLCHPVGDSGSTGPIARAERWWLSILTRALAPPGPPSTLVASLARRETTRRARPTLFAMSRDDASKPDVAQRDSERTFDRLIDEGQQRLGRSWSGLIATGVLGGLDVGVGVLALLLVEHATGSKILGGLAFAVGLIALTLARSELFTEDFLVPVAAVVTKTSTWFSLLRLWAVTMVMNLLGGWLIAAIIVVGFPSLRSTAAEAAKFYITLGARGRRSPSHSWVAS